jgi:hypothetical protein
VFDGNRRLALTAQKLRNLPPSHCECQPCCHIEDVVWKPFLALLVIGSILFCIALARFRKTITQMA